MAWSSSGLDIRVSNHLRFLTWHPALCLSVFTSYYGVALVRWFWAAQPCHWPGAMCYLHWSSPPSGLYCPMLAWWIHPGRCFLAMPRPSGIPPAFEGTLPCQFPQFVFMKRHNPVDPWHASDMFSQSDTWLQRLTWCVLVAWSLTPVTPAGELFTSAKWLTIFSLPCQHCLQKLDDSFWEDVFAIFYITRPCLVY